MVPNERATLTLLFTDIEGSTALWEQASEAMDQAVQAHHQLLIRIVEEHGGDVVKLTGDGIFAAFTGASAAVRAAAASQRELLASTWTVGSLRVRMGLHTGECAERAGDLYGRAVNKAARIEQAAYGGQVLLSATTAELVRDDLDEGLSLAYLGEHHFDGIIEPERVFQLSVAGLDNEHPQLRARDVGLEQLPAELTPLIGRSQESEGLQAELERSRLVTLVGAPGVGKSRLALRVATEVARERSSGVRFIDLAPCRRSDAVPGLVANGLGVRQGHEQSYLAAIVRALRSADTLVVFDNCEHVLDEIVPLVAEMVSSCPNITVLATSRERLSLPFELAVTLTPLSLPTMGASTLEALESSPAAELLFERLRATGVLDRLGDEDAGLVGELCRRCDGLPLAIELAAAGLEQRTPAELLADLEGTIRHLGPDSGRARWGRHAGLSEALDSSYLSLQEHEQVLFDSMAVFAGFVTVDAVAEVIGVSVGDARSVLEHLARRSLVSVERHRGRLRYRLLESVRQYADEHGRVDDELRRRHADHVLELAEALQAEMRTERNRDAYRDVAAHFDDVRLALSRLLEAGRLGDAARLVGAMHEYCMFTLRVEHFHWALSLWDQVEPESLERARLGPTLTIGLWYRGEHERAVEVGEEAVRATAASPESSPVNVIWVHTGLLNSFGFLQDFENAVHHLMKVIELSIAAPEQPYWSVNAFATDALGLATVGRFEEAVEKATEAVELAERLGHPDALAWAYYTLASGLRVNDPEGAQVALDRGLAAARSVAGRWNEGVVLSEMLALQTVAKHPDAMTTALDLLGHLRFGGGEAQLWEAVVLSSRLLADAGQLREAAVLLGSHAGRRAQPRAEVIPVGAALRMELSDSLGPDELGRAEAEGRYLRPNEVFDRCQAALEDIVHRR